MSIRFYPASHRYKLTYEPDGEEADWAPGVTTIINQTKPKELAPYGAERAYRALHDMYEKAGVQAVAALLDQGLAPGVEWARALPNEYRDRRGERGTTIHDLVEPISTGEQVDVPAELVAPVQAATRFLDEWGIEPLLTEAVVGNRTHWYCGKFDMLGTDRLGRVVLIDYKSGGWVFEDAAYQLQAYADAEFFCDADGTEYPLPAVPELHVVVHLTEDGHYDALPMARGPEVSAEFLHMRALYDGFKRAKGSKRRPGYVGAPLPPPTEEGVA